MLSGLENKIKTKKNRPRSFHIFNQSILSCLHVELEELLSCGLLYSSSLVTFAAALKMGLQRVMRFRRAVLWCSTDAEAVRRNKR